MAIERSDNAERHPSFGLARFNTVQSNPGASLFDSEIKHSHYVIFEVDTASRRRELHRDWLHPEKTVLKLEMSMAQFGALVSSFGNGQGVPVTLSYTQEDGQIDNPPYEPRLAQTTKEVEDTTERLFADVTRAVDEVCDAFDEKLGRKEMKELLHTLEMTLKNAAPNARFAAKSMTEHVEAVVTKARYDIEAQVQMAAERGLDTGDSVAGLLGTGE